MGFRDRIDDRRPCDLLSWLLVLRLIGTAAPWSLTFPGPPVVGLVPEIHGVPMRAEVVFPLFRCASVTNGENERKFSARDRIQVQQHSHLRAHQFSRCLERDCGDDRGL